MRIHRATTSLYYVKSLPVLFDSYVQSIITVKPHGSRFVPFRVMQSIWITPYDTPHHPAIYRSITLLNRDFITRFIQHRITPGTHPIRQIDAHLGDAT